MIDVRIEKSQQERSARLMAQNTDAPAGAQNIKDGNVMSQQSTSSAQKTPALGNSPKITVIGVGGAGCNAVNNMIATNLEGVDFMGCNTDAQALSESLCDIQIQLGNNITGGLGAGANPEVGRAAAEESIDEVLGWLEDVNMVFITAGMGGGTGTGAAPVIAKAIREKGILTVGVVTKPFHFEGAHRMKAAEAGIEELQEYVDTLIVIPNQNLFRLANEKTTFSDAFKLADGVLQSGVRGVTDLMVMPGMINLDFADIRAVMLEMGKAMMGTGEAEGERRAIEAAEKAINNPLLDDVSMKGARAVIINITGGHDMTLFEVDEACNRIRDEVDGDANIIFGTAFDEQMEGQIRVSIVATGIEADSMRKTRGPSNFFSTSMSGSPQGGQPSGRVSPKTTERNVASAQRSVPQDSGFSSGESVSRQVESVSAQKPDVKEPSEPQRATREGNAFIPPQPVEASSAARNLQGITYPNQQQQRERHFSEQSDFAQERVSAPSYDAQAETAAMQTEDQPVAAPSAPQRDVRSERPQGLVLNPPKAPEPQKRPPSLFERFSVGNWKGKSGQQEQGYGQSENEDQQQSETQSSGSASSGGGMPPFASLRAERPVTPSQQGSLGIDVAAQTREQPKAEAREDDLDIPAFLRRQAN